MENDLQIVGIPHLYTGGYPMFKDNPQVGVSENTVYPHFIAILIGKMMIIQWI